MNEEINPNIIAGNGGLAPMQNIVQQREQQVSQPTKESGLGNVGQQVPYQRNSSLAMFELANAEKNKAKEMFYENEAMKSKTMQQDLGSEKQAMQQQAQQSQIDNSILGALKSGAVDEATANAIFQDSRVSDNVKQQIADTLYPSEKSSPQLNFGDERNIDANRATGQYMNVDNEMSQYVPEATAKEISMSQGYGN